MSLPRSSNSVLRIVGARTGANAKRCSDCDRDNTHPLGVLAEDEHDDHSSCGISSTSVTPGSMPACVSSVVSWPRWCV
jgi:hypothetical protein